MNKRDVSKYLYYSILCVFVFVLTSFVSATDCWDLDTRTTCINASDCRWDSWMDSCYRLDCRSLWEQDDCTSAGDLGLSCSWTSSGETGWCEDGAGCWNYESNSTCSAASGCKFEGNAYCEEITCWNQNNRDDCEAHEDIDCYWDGWSCMEEAGDDDCWNKNSNAECSDVSGCMWESNGEGMCEQLDCWNQNTESACNEMEGCEWEYDEWMGRYQCMNFGGCWDYASESVCEEEGCYWDTSLCWGSGSNTECWNYDDDLEACAAAEGCSVGECNMKDCFIFDGTDSSTCESNSEGLTCEWRAECRPDGPMMGGSSNCWDYSTSETCEADSDCAWGACQNRGCWGYSTEANCEANSCFWRSESSGSGWCEDYGCWNAFNSTDCSTHSELNTWSNCEWNEDAGWCGDENCWNYDSETGCEASSIDCIWNSDGSYCYEQGCWNWNNQSECLSHSENSGDCVWDGSYCNSPGCWNHQNNETSCDAQTNCEWNNDGWCFEEGCWDYSNQSTCDGASSCSWEGNGWCENPGCWNYKTKTNCDERSECDWDTEWNSCRELNCWDFSTETNCEAYNSSLDCAWNGWNCYDSTACWNYWNSSSCGDGAGCSWNTYYNCKEQACWNYDTNATCSADSSCNWNTWCSGDSTLSCWNYNSNETGCVAAGCKFDGNCNEKGCWSYDTQSACCGSSDCTENNDCGWEDNSWCGDVGCWDYVTESTCDADSICNWNDNYNYCYEVGCYAYNSNANCSEQSFRNCVWNDVSNYCYQGGCWNYNTESSCDTDDSGYGNCNWNSEWNSCQEQGCWYLEDQTTCDVRSDCEWQSSGWCYNLGCWNYNTDEDCSANSDCDWNDDYEYCYEKGCWDFSDSTNCTALTKCSWNNASDYCYEQGCWDYNSNATCAGDDNCFWGANSYCTQGGCGDYSNNDLCTADASEYGGCAWDSTWGYCYEEGCWSNSNQTECDSASCYWNSDGWGWCSEEGCWDYYTQSNCEGASGCLWESTYDYCYEEGCWSQSNTSDCSTAGCNWHTDSWGWCEEFSCWSLSSSDACNNESDSIACTWQDDQWGGYCEDVGCWNWDGNETGCTDYSITGALSLNCTYSGQWCEPALGYCAQYNGRQSDCMDTKYCEYDYTDDECNEPDSAGATEFEDDMILYNPQCWLFDADSAACNNVTICNYTASSCDNLAGQESSTIQCENITNRDLCTSLPALSTCCQWRSGNCTTDNLGDSCWANLQEPPTGAKQCDDYNAYSNQDLCEQIAGSPWYMPCVWNNDYCDFNMDGVGETKDIRTQERCENFGNVWNTETYCDDNGTAVTTDDMLKLEEWCDAGSGTSTTVRNCGRYCYDCEYQNNGTVWDSSTLAQQACTGSGASCEFTEDINAPNSFGYCGKSTAITTSGSCDSRCASCNDVEDDSTTSTPETKIACLESESDCKWVKNLANKSIGTCKKESALICEDKCSACTRTECSSYGLGVAGSCEWDSDEELCLPLNFNAELCANGKDDDGDGETDCDDAGCSFECGEGDLMHDCYKFDALGETICTNSLDSSGINCTWNSDPWGGSWCGHPSETCWQYDDNAATCNSQNGACRYNAGAGFCDFNKTVAESCFGKLESSCSTDCKWITDENNPRGGFCDFKMFALCHQSNMTSQSVCTSGTNSQYCAWEFSSDSPNGGWCNPKCFSLDENSCGSSSKCEWMSGWCEPNMTMSGDCVGFDNNQASCESAPACVWDPAGEELGDDCDIDFTDTTYIKVDCETSYYDETNCNADSNCTWVIDRFNVDNDFFGENPGYCNNKAEECYGMIEAQCDAATSFGCEWVSIFGGYELCVHTCNYNSSAGGQNCGDLAGCTEMTGWCDPRGCANMFNNMDRPPEMIAEDDCPESGKPDYMDLCGAGIKDDPDSFGIGVRVTSLTDAAVCNGKDIMDVSVFPPTSEEGSGEEPTKFAFYLDSDGRTDVGCNSSSNAAQGFEWKFVLESTRSEPEGLSKYICKNGEWESSSVKACTMANKICGEAGGPVVMLDKNSAREFNIDGITKFNMRYDFNVRVESMNVSSGVIIDVVSGTYRQGVADFMQEDCAGTADTDGDGLAPRDDPDCEDFFRYGGNKFEDCLNGIDDNNNELVDCDDDECSTTPHCGGSFFSETGDANDNTSATITTYTVEEFLDSAFVKYDSSEPANGTVLFYYNSSRCNVLNKSVYDIGLTNSNIPKYRIGHETYLDSTNLGYALINGSTYFYKLKVCDLAGNPCSTSACLNFTTEQNMRSCGISCQPVYDIIFNADDSDIESSTASDDPTIQWDDGEGYEDKGCGGLGVIRKNYTQTNDLSARITNAASVGGSGLSASTASTTWALEFHGMNVKGAVDTNKTTIDEDELLTGTSGGNSYVGLDHSAWEDLAGELNPDTIDICVPGQHTKLYHCGNVSAISTTACTDVTSQAVAGPTYNSALGCTEFTVPADLGFSVYFGNTPSSGSTGTTGGGGGGGGSSSTTTVATVVIPTESGMPAVVEKNQDITFLTAAGEYVYKVTSIGVDYITIVSQGVIADSVVLKKDVGQIYDFNDDGNLDVKFLLTAVSADSATITTYLIAPPKKPDLLPLFAKKDVVEEVVEEEVPIVEEQPAPVAEPVVAEPEPVVDAPEPVKESWLDVFNFWQPLYWLYVGAAIVIIAVLLFIFIPGKKAENIKIAEVKTDKKKAKK
ncbi:hypothetical protein HOK51_03780 [Candidatus Woesearchaeota archaeon]|jgi:hypothetical protein|nr:hypothetical protein [Candidatus Woesearchaeota archaeon]MBT6518942.1 hypothetical protein [Candidatus Woesearchaeota archaeon]MBT7367610.1 hypothetical protein [Candidatus Woesearchaeota archaeon]